MSVPLLDGERALVEAVARRVVELLDERQAQPVGLVDAATLAGMLGLSTSTVYEHAARLGGIQLGSGRGSKRLIRFDVAKALAAWTPCETSERSEVPDPPPPVSEVRRRRRRAAQSGAGLLPVKGADAA